MNKLLHHSNEFFLLRDFPEEPICGYTNKTDRELSAIKLKDYNKALEACIAAKTRIDSTPSSKTDLYELFDITRSKGKRYIKGKLLEDGSIFDLPDNVEFEEGEEFIANDHWFPIDLKDKYEGKTIYTPMILRI